jgi:hypothetical protein
MISPSLELRTKVIPKRFVHNLPHSDIVHLAWETTFSWYGFSSRNMNGDW